MSRFTLLTTNQSTQGWALRWVAVVCRRELLLIIFYSPTSGRATKLNTQSVEGLLVIGDLPAHVNRVVEWIPGFNDPVT